MQYGAQHPTTKSQLKENMVKNRYKTTLPCKYKMMKYRLWLLLFNGMNNIKIIREMCLS